MNIGMRAHDIEKRPLPELVEELGNKGVACVQFALAKSLDVPSHHGALSPGFGRHVKNAFDARGIQIAVLGCYFNMIDPDHTERRKGMDRFKEHLRYARDFGCSIVATETGNVHSKMGYTTDNFDEEPFQEVVRSVREMVAEAEKFGVIVGIEAGVNHPVHTVEKMKRLLDAVDSQNLQVVFDPMNLMTLENHQEQEKVFEEAMEAFGHRIAIFHAKDFKVEDGVLSTAPVGTGLMNYNWLFGWLKANKPYINIIMEETVEPYIDDSLAFLKNKYEQA